MSCGWISPELGRTQYRRGAVVLTLKSTSKSLVFSSTSEHSEDFFGSSELGSAMKLLNEDEIAYFGMLHVSDQQYSRDDASQQLRNIMTVEANVAAHLGRSGFQRE